MWPDTFSSLHLLSFQCVNISTIQKSVSQCWQVSLCVRNVLSLNKNVISVICIFWLIHLIHLVWSSPCPVLSLLSVFVFLPLCSRSMALALSSHLFSPVFILLLQFVYSITEGLPLCGFLKLVSSSPTEVRVFFPYLFVIWPVGGAVLFLIGLWITLNSQTEWRGSYLIGRPAPLPSGGALNHH